MIYLAPFELLGISISILLLGGKGLIDSKKLLFAFGSDFKLKLIESIILRWNKVIEEFTFYGLHFVFLSSLAKFPFKTYLKTFKN